MYCRCNRNYHCKVAIEAIPECDFDRLDVRECDLSDVLC